MIMGILEHTMRLSRLEYRAHQAGFPKKRWERIKHIAWDIQSRNRANNFADILESHLELFLQESPDDQ